MSKEINIEAEAANSKKTGKPDGNSLPQKLQKPVKKRMVYVGPTIAGIVVQNTIFNNGISSLLKEAIKEMPGLESLLVPISELPSAMKEINSKKGALYMLSERAKQYRPKKGE